MIAQAGDSSKYLDKTAISNASGSKGLWQGLRRAGRAYKSEEVKDSLACAVSYLCLTGKKNPDSKGDGLLITSTSDGVDKTEMSQEGVKKAVAAFHSETLEASFRRATVHAYTIWAICMDVWHSTLQQDRLGEVSCLCDQVCGFGWHDSQDVPGYSDAD